MKSRDEVPRQLKKPMAADARRAEAGGNLALASRLCAAAALAAELYSPPPPVLTVTMNGVDVTSLLPLLQTALNRKKPEHIRINALASLTTDYPLKGGKRPTRKALRRLLDKLDQDNCSTSTPDARM